MDDDDDDEPSLSKMLKVFIGFKLLYTGFWHHFGKGSDVIICVLLHIIRGTMLGSCLLHIIRGTMLGSLSGALLGSFCALCIALLCTLVSQYLCGKLFGSLQPRHVMPCHV